MVCNILFLGRFEDRDRRRLVLCGGEELRPDDCVPWELHDSAGIVRVLWEQHVSAAVFLIRIPYPRVRHRF